MPEPLTRREAIKQIAAASAGALVAPALLRGQGADIIIAGQPVTIAVSSVSPATVRITALPIVDGKPAPVPLTGALADAEAARALTPRPPAEFGRVVAGDLIVRVTTGPPTIHVTRADGTDVQRLTL